MTISPLPLAQALIRCKSVTPKDDGAIKVLEDFLGNLGFVCHRLPFGKAEGRPEIQNLYARLGTKGPHLCFAGHTDVVPAGEGWSVDPFAAEIRDDFLIGRGIVDMKGAIACFAAAIANHLEKGALAGSISFLITGDEEGPAFDGTKRVLDWMKEKGEQPDWCLVGEPSNPHHVGETIKIGRRGSLNGKIIVEGRQGHVAYPDLADNPIPHLLSLLGCLTEKPLDQGTAHFQPSNLEIVSIDVGNQATNVIPKQARAAFNVRFNDGYSGETLTQELIQRLDQAKTPYQLSTEISGESFVTKEGAFSQALSEAILAQTGQKPVLNTTGGTSDARFIKDLCPVVEFGLVSASAHQIDEKIAISEMVRLTAIYEDLISRMVKI